MSRITPPITKFTHTMQSIRRISSSALTAHPSSQLRSATAASRKLSDLKSIDGKTESNSQARPHSTLSPHRPLTKPIRPTPLMQGFRTSAPLSSSPAPTTSALDYYVLPTLPFSSETPTLKLRVPLLPDNYSSSHIHQPEMPDLALPKAEINVVGMVDGEEAPVVASLTEVVGNEGLGDVDLGVAVWAKAKGEEIRESIERSGEVGLLRELWEGIREDIVGGSGRGKVAV